MEQATLRKISSFLVVLLIAFLSILDVEGEAKHNVRRNYK